METPITFKSTRTKSDLNWHFFYVCKRGFWKRVLWVSAYLLVGISAVIIINDDIGDFDFAVLKEFVPLFFMALPIILLLMYTVDYICLVYMHWKMAKKFSNQTAELSFDAQAMVMKHEHGEATQNYDMFQKIHLHKHLIVFQAAYRLFYIMAWRDVPAEQRNQLQKLLEDVKTRLKI